MTDWSALGRQFAVADIADELMDERSDLNWTELRDNTCQALCDLDEVTVIIEDELQSDCGGGGYYDGKSREIHLHPSILRRDNFTLLHEFGHHLQQQHFDWSMGLLDLPPGTRRRLEEKVCDTIAHRILLPSSGGVIESWNARPADLMLWQFEHRQASRSAVVQHVADELGSSAKWILVVADRGGRVQAARTTYSDLQPAKGSTQPAFARVADAAVDGPVRRNLSPAIVYGSGDELHGMRADAVLDPGENWVFVALAPIHRFGTGEFVHATFECPRPQCETTFRPNDVQQRCETCHEPFCPECRRRTCECAESKRTCIQCFTEWTPAQIQLGSHTCYE